MNAFVGPYRGIASNKYFGCSNSEGLCNRYTNIIVVTEEQKSY
jgi:hypothetical protein